MLILLVSVLMYAFFTNAELAGGPHSRTWPRSLNDHQQLEFLHRSLAPNLSFQYI
jgi:hypothetical protein